MNIISYNLNGIRSALGKGFAEWLSSENPDIACIQETKAQPEQIDNSVFESLGYNCYWFSAKKKGYSGVGLLSKQKPDKIVYGVNNELFDDEGRFLRADYGDISVISTYFPSGSNDERQQIKMLYLEFFRKYIKKLQNVRKKLVINGDFNICRLWIDIHNPNQQQNTSGFLPEEREWFQNFIDDGFTDAFRHINNEPHKYSWWSYRAGARPRNKGWRIDYSIISNNLTDKIKNADILKDVVHSDHCPVKLCLDI